MNNEKRIIGKKITKIEYINRENPLEHINVILEDGTKLIEVMRIDAFNSETTGKGNEYQNRVILEKRELDEKLNKLKIFVDIDLFKELNVGEQARLRFQLICMKAYSDILYDRINAFQGEK